ncbi:Protein WVD2-like 7 [Vitis vinifera]|uniref:Protein WVD2-like 7 n=1 Tax=Vitis vinifera TaxID=29760 RepID=A0A438JR89_VITVI|nr:Protein WVD2-like 7 [Vitis vinifera]
MGESACLRRSFSDSSSDPRMFGFLINPPLGMLGKAKFGNFPFGDAIRALGDSISFGRFMSESLAWEKWSSFSQNRYLEEAEKFSKPGSVAQKKAYFEAHYKRIAAKKAAEAEAAANDFPEPEALDEIHNTSSDDLDTVKENSHMIIDESEGQEALNTNTVVDEIHNSSSDELDTLKENSPMIIDEPEGQEEAPNTQLVVDCVENIELEEVKVEEVEETEPVTVQTVIEESPRAQTEFSDQIENVEEERMPLKEVADEEKNLALRSNKKLTKSSSKSSAQGRASKLGASPAKLTSLVHVRKENNASPSTKKPAPDALNKKRFTPKSLHMSINFASLAGETSKKASPVLQKNRNSRINAIAAKITEENSTPRRTTIRTSMSGISKHTSATTPQSENRRTRTLLDQSVSGNRTAEGKWQSLLAEFAPLGKFFIHQTSNGYAKLLTVINVCALLPNRRPQPSVACGSKSRSPIISSPFRFRSEERFFQKLEEKNAKEAEKMQLQTKSKEKPGTDLKKLRRSITFKAIPTTDSCRETESPSNHMMKVTKPISNLGVCCLCYSLYCTPWKGSCRETDSPGNHKKKEKGESELKKLRHSITFKPGSCRETDSPGNHMKKEKGESELKKLRHSITFKPGSSHETDLPGNHIKKTPPTRPRSPKLGRKPTPNAVVQDTNSRPPRVPSSRTDSSKPATEKNKLLLPKNNSQENASPNIHL